MKIKDLFKEIISDCFDANEECLEAFSGTIKILKEISNLKGDKNKLYDIFQKALESDVVLTKDVIVILSKKFDMERDKIIKSIEKFDIQENKPKRKANLKESHMPTFRQYINGNY